MEELKIPKVGIDKDEILKKMEGFKSNDADWKNGKTFSLVYYVDDDHYKFLKKAHNMFFSENALNPMAFKSLKEFERESVQMTANMLNGDENCVGVQTSGGTESILMAVKAYRDRARKLKPWILRPEIVVPETIHVAFFKACKYFGVKCKKVPMDEDYRVNIKKLKKAVSKNTIMIGASAPQYPHGVIDPIEEIAEFANRKGIPMHVDACIGGFILPWIEKLGYPISSLWDFRVPGVTSISLDFHKYGYAAKGSSCLVYKSMDYLKYQFFICENWPGGVYASPSFPGTRPGGPIAATWAALKALGEEGYIEQTKRVMEARQKFLDALNTIPEVEVVGEPESSIVAYKSKNDRKLNTYVLADFLEAKGWNVDRQSVPECIHHTISPHHTKHIEDYINDIKEGIEWVKENPQIDPSGNAAMYGMMAKIPFKGMVYKAVQGVMENMYSREGRMPDEKNETPQSIMEFAEKLGGQALEVKRQVDVAIDKFRNK